MNVLKEDWGGWGGRGQYWVFSWEVTCLWIGECGIIVSRSMIVTAHEFIWLDTYMSFGCATSDYTPLFNVSGCKGII